MIGPCRASMDEKVAQVKRSACTIRSADDLVADRGFTHGECLPPEPTILADRGRSKKANESIVQPADFRKALREGIQSQ
jgi:hypothetical protein